MTKKRESMFELDERSAVGLRQHLEHVQTYQGGLRHEGYLQALRDIIRLDSPLCYGRQVNRPDLVFAVDLSEALFAVRCAVRSPLKPAQFRALHHANPAKCCDACKGWCVSRSEGHGDESIELCDACWSDYAGATDDDAAALPEAQAELKRRTAAA